MGRHNRYLPRSVETLSPTLILLFLTGFIPTLIVSTLNILAGDPMVVNVRNVWLPFADTVLNGGIPYESQWDNKPPLWQFLNLAIAATGEYRLVFYLLVAATNGVATILIWRLCSRRNRERAGILAAVFYATSLIYFNGDVINPRPFAALAILGAFFSWRAVVRGGLIAIAGLFSQFSILVIPAVLVDQAINDKLSTDWFGRFAAAGIAIVGLSFAVVALAWNPDAAVLGIQYSFGSTAEYVSGYANRELTVWAGPLAWGRNQFHLAKLIAAPLLFSGVAITTYLRGQQSSLIPVTALAAVGLLIPIVIRPSSLYWLPPLPFIAILGAIGVQELFEGQLAS